MQYFLRARGISRHNTDVERVRSVSSKLPPGTPHRIQTEGNVYMSSAAKLLFRKEFCAVCVLALLAVVGQSEAAAQTIEWTRQFGTTANDEARAVAADATAVYVAGVINSGAALPGQSSAGGQDAFLRKYDTAGNEVWTRQFGTASSESALGVAVDATGVYVVGSTNGTFAGQTSAGGQDVFVRKYDAAGAVQWTSQFGSSNFDSGLGVATNSSGIYVVGTSFGSLPGQVSAGEEDAFLRKYDASGTVQWTRQFGTSASESDTAVASDSNGVYVAGTTGGVFPGQTDGPFTDVYVRRYDISGAEQWTRQFGSAGSFPVDSAAGLAVDSSGVYVSGATLGNLPSQTSTGGEDAFIRKFDLSGTELWTRQFGATDSSSFSGASGVAAGGGGVTVGGDTTGALPDQTKAGEEDIYARRFDPNGTALWTRQLGSTKSDFVYGVSAISTDFYAAGATLGTLPGQTSIGSTDAFVVRISSPTVCSYSITPENQAYASSGGSGTVTVDSSAGCPWTATSNSPFITITGGASGSGTGTVNYTVSANISTTPRSGTLTIAGKTFSITQAGIGCDFLISPTSQAFAAAGGTGTVTVTGPQGCPWTAQSTAAFVTITVGASGSGNGTVNYTVSANASATPRSGTLTIAGSTFTVTQAGAGCDLSISPTSQTFTAAGGTGTVTVIGPQGCPWTAQSTAAFVTITAGASGSGNGTVAYTVAANPNTSQRTGTLLIAGSAFTVTQGAASVPTPAVDEGGVVSYGSLGLGAGPVAPGSIALVQGSNLNDGSSAFLSSIGPDGKLVTTLGGTSVTINDTPAPIFFSTAGQLCVQIPFEVAGQTSATIVVTVGGRSSAPRTFPLAAAAPLILTINQQGPGRAAALHENGVAPVTTENPAHPGELVTFFLTGLGTLNPPLATGATATGNPTAATPTLTMDGVQASLDSSVGAAGFVGLYQVKASVPASTRTAVDIPVALTIGGKQSNSVTIPVGP